jgi:fatty-acid desaturase
VAYITFYVQFAEYWWMFLLLPIHFLMGPIHGAVVNWCGHKYGYSNYDNDDHSKNSLPLDFLMLGELFQNNHHKKPNNVNFALKWYEFDPSYPVIKLAVSEDIFCQINEDTGVSDTHTDFVLLSMPRGCEKEGNYTTIA